MILLTKMSSFISGLLMILTVLPITSQWGRNQWLQASDTSISRETEITRGVIALLFNESSKGIHFFPINFGPFAVLFGGNCLEHTDYDTATSRWDALVLFEMWRRVRLHPCNSIEGWRAAGSRSSLREDQQQPLKVKSIIWRFIFYFLFYTIMCTHITFSHTAFSKCPTAPLCCCLSRQRGRSHSSASQMF